MTGFTIDRRACDHVAFYIHNLHSSDFNGRIRFCPLPHFHWYIFKAEWAVNMKSKRQTFIQYTYACLCVSTKLAQMHHQIIKLTEMLKIDLLRIQNCRQRMCSYFRVIVYDLTKAIDFRNYLNNRLDDKFRPSKSFGFMEKSVNLVSCRFLF